MKIQTIEGMVALVLLLLVWLVATYFVARQAKGIRERRFMVRAGIAVLSGVLALTALDHFAIEISGGLFGVILFFTLLSLRRWQLSIRRQEQI